MLKNSPVIDLMKSHQVISNNTTISDAIVNIQESSAHCLIITNEKDELAGIFTEEDIVNKVIDTPLFGEEPITDFTDPDPLCLNESADFTQALDSMGRNNLRYLPICDQDNKPTGLFTIREMIYFIASNVEIVENKVVLKKDVPQDIFGKSHDAILEVLNLPINFAVSSYGSQNIVKLAAQTLIGDAIGEFKGSGMVAGLVFNNNKVDGLFRVRDIPFKLLQKNTSVKDLTVSDLVKELPETIVETDTIGMGIKNMANNNVLYLHFCPVEGKDGLITARGLLAYMYAHIYDDE